MEDPLVRDGGLPAQTIADLLDWRQFTVGEVTIARNEYDLLRCAVFAHREVQRLRLAALNDQRAA